MKQLLIILLAGFLYACGGGDSTSGGSESASSTSLASVVSASATSSASTATAPTTASSPSNSAPAASSSLAGTYVGNASGVISVGGGAISEPFSEPFTVVVDENNLATVSVDGNSQTIAISNGTVNVSIPFDESEDELRCVGTLQLALSVGTSAISGTITGSGTCNQSGLQADFVIENGNIAATRQ